MRTRPGWGLLTCALFPCALGHAPMGRAAEPETHDSETPVEESQPDSDPDAAKTVAAEGQLLLEAFEGAAAAERFERAHSLDSQDIWRVAAAEAWLVAAEPERALTHLRALREGASPRLRELAEALLPIVTRARAATLQGAHRDAARAWTEAFAKKAVGRYRLEEARSTLRAGGDAQALFADLDGRSDLSRAERSEVADVLVRLRNPLPTLPERPNSAPTAAPMWMVVGGGALLIGGVVAVVVADGQRADVRESLARDPGARDLTRAEALTLWNEAQTLNAVGLIGGGVGLLLAGSGALWGSMGGVGFRF